MKKLALLTLHGMGKFKPNYYRDLEDGLQKRLGAGWAAISFQPVQYGDLLQVPEEELWQDMAAANDLDFVGLRQFLLYGFGDAGSLEHSAHAPGDTKYKQVQRRIQDRLRAALLDLGNDPAKPVVVVAQSLGCQVVSNYIWDAQHNRQIFAGTEPDQTPAMQFLRLATLANLTTTGCNIPVFIAGLSPRVCFTPPAACTWDNYFDPDDVLGWPLRQLGPTFGFINDRAINAGGVFTSWNPASHGEYWSDGDVLDPLADRLRRLLP
jgi:hypothetical protein